MGVLVGLVAFLTVVSVLNILVTLGLTRRLRQGGSPSSHASLPLVGTHVKPFSATTLEGTGIDLDSIERLGGGVAFVSATCEPCKKLVDRLLAEPPIEPVTFFVSGDDSQTSRLASTLSEVGSAVVIPHDSDVRSAFDVKAFPTLLRVSDGVIVSAGFSPSEIGLRRGASRAAVAVS